MLTAGSCACTERRLLASVIGTARWRELTDQAERTHRRAGLRAERRAIVFRRPGGATSGPIDHGTTQRRAGARRPGRRARSPRRSAREASRQPPRAGGAGRAARPRPGRSCGAGARRPEPAPTRASPRFRRGRRCPDCASESRCETITIAARGQSGRVAGDVDQCPAAIDGARRRRGRGRRGSRSPQLRGDHGGDVVVAGGARAALGLARASEVISPDAVCAVERVRARGPS